MKYLLSIYVSDESTAAIERDLMPEFDAAHTWANTELRRTGEFVDSAELSVRDARAVRVADGAPIVTDGPYTEGKEYVGGYYLVDVASLDRAVEIAGRFVEARFHPVDVRRMGGDVERPPRA